MSREDLENAFHEAINGAKIRLKRFNDPFALEALEAEKEWVSSYTTFSWVRVRPNTWALSLTGSEILIVEKNGKSILGVNLRKWSL